MTVNTDIIILHTTKFGENSLVIHTLSREYGRRSFLVRGIGKRMPASFFLPMNILEADIAESAKSTLFTVKNLTPKIRTARNPEQYLQEFHHHVHQRGALPSHPGRQQ